MIGWETKPPTTLAKAPSIPATTIRTRAFFICSMLSNRRCNPATPTSKIVSTLLPNKSAVTAASSAIGISEVPAVTIVIQPTGSFTFLFRITRVCACSLYLAPFGRNVLSFLNVSALIFVASVSLFAFLRLRIIFFN